ncbi:6983_t:CDS:2, partial [Dentiscutata heterogama]
PKQSEQLKDAQKKCRYSKIYQPINDIPTRWNSSYLAWVQLRELRKTIDYLVLMLTSESEWCGRLDGEYLKLTNLTENECYPSLNLIYPTMRLLIRKFSPSREQTEDDYAKLLFGLIGPSQPTNDENPDELDIEDEFDIQIISEQLQTPEEIGLVASFLDLRIKYLKFFIELDKSPTILTFDPATTNDLIAALYSSEEPKDEILNETKVDCYLCEPVEKMGYNLLTW